MQSYDKYGQPLIIILLISFVSLVYINLNYLLVNLSVWKNKYIMFLLKMVSAFGWRCSADLRDYRVLLHWTSNNSHPV